MYKSLVGTLMTVFALTTVTSYAVYKWDILTSRSQSSIMTTTEESYFTDKETSLSIDDGFKLAFALVQNNQRAPIVSDPSHGTLKAQMSYYKVLEKDKLEHYTEDIKLRPCSRDDFPEVMEDNKAS